MESFFPKRKYDRRDNPIEGMQQIKMIYFSKRPSPKDL